ncbi:MAG: helicase, partial [Cyanobacteria bacterium P01_G01_bin.54]
MTSSLSIVQGTNTKPVSSQALVNFFAQSKNMDGELFIGYPVISSPQGRYPIDALWISPKKGIIVFDLIEGIELSDFADRQDDNANKVEARLKTYRELVKRRKLIIPIHTLSFAPGIPDISKSIGEDIEEGYEIANTVTIEHSLEAFGWDDYNIEGYQ